MLLGTTTNTAFLERVLADPDFASGATHTGFLDEHLSAVALSAVIRLSAGGQKIGEAHEPVRDLDGARPGVVFSLVVN